MLGEIFSRGHFKIVIYFSYKIGLTFHDNGLLRFDISRQKSSKETISVKCESLCTGKIKMSSAVAQRVVKVKMGILILDCLCVAPDGTLFSTNKYGYCFLNCPQKCVVDTRYSTPCSHMLLMRNKSNFFDSLLV